MKSGARSVALLIPGLFGPSLAGARVWEGMALPVLEQWLARAERSDTHQTGFERSLFALFGARTAADADVPAAAVTRQWDRGDAGAQHWLRADPVHVRADRDRLVMLGNTALDISGDECAELADELGMLFRDDGWRLDAVNARRWYLRLDGDPRVRTTPLLDAVGRDVLHCMPQGPDARRWRSLLNEVQMVLHASRVNQARAAAGRLTINSLWFWGGGVLPALAPGAWSFVWSNEATATALAALAGVPHASLPADAEELLEDDTPGMHLAVLDGARERVQLVDVEGWQIFLQGVHEAWLAPLYHAVKRRIVADVTLYTADGTALRLDSRGARRWWVRRRPLAAWAQEEGAPTGD